MSAEVIDLRYERLYLKAIHHELNSWGRWIERHSDYEGYPGLTNVEAFLNGRGGGQAGHKILCLDMPSEIYATHGRVIRLNETLQEAIWLFYVPRVKADGTLWETREKCERAGIFESALYQRLHRAKRLILGIYPTHLQECQEFGT